MGEWSGRVENGDTDARNKVKKGQSVAWGARLTAVRRLPAGGALAQGALGRSLDCAPGSTSNLSAKPPLLRPGLELCLLDQRTYPDYIPAKKHRLHNSIYCNTMRKGT